MESAGRVYVSEVESSEVYLAEVESAVRVYLSEMYVSGGFTWLR